MAATSARLVDIIREDILKELNKNGGYLIVYTHLGKNDSYPYISKETQKALKLLEREFRKGNIYVTTTAKLLKYYVNNKYLIWHASKNGNDRNIHIVCISGPVRGTFVPTIDDLRGITFYTVDTANTHIFIQDRKVGEIIKNEKDYAMNYSVMIPLKPLLKLDDKMKEYKKKGYFGSYSTGDIRE